MRYCGGIHEGSDAASAFSTSMTDFILVADGQGPRQRSSSRTVAIALLFLIAALTLVVCAVTRPQHDFIEYWTAAHILSNHGNPYSLNEMYQAQRSLGWSQTAPLMFLSPPWTLGLVLPLGLTNSYGFAWMVWVAALAGVVALSSYLLMEVYFAELRIPEVSDTALYRSLFAFTFYPVLLSFRFAQTSPLLLLGLAGFLYFETRSRRFLAGALLSLTLVKPQLLYLVWIALFFSSFQQRRWKILVSAIATIGVLTAFGLLLDPYAVREYLELASGPYPRVIPSGIVFPIRKLLGGGAFWVQFVPLFLGLSWFAWYWRKHRKEWSWAERLPQVVTASVLTSTYGWLFDQAVLVVPVIALASQAARTTRSFPRSVVILYTALNCALILVMAVPPIAFLPAPVFITLALWNYERSRALVPIRVDTIG